MTDSNYASYRTNKRNLIASNKVQALAAATALAAPTLFFSTDQAQAQDAPSRVHALVNFEFANEYTTPRGMMVRDKGLTVQPLFLGLINVYKGDSFFNDVTLVAGVWNDLGTSGVSVHPPYGSSPKTPWTEVDPIAGISFSFAKNLKLDITYTAFVEQILDIGTSQHLEVKLGFDDSPYLKAFALHPYVSIWQEIQNKATDARLPGGIIGLPPVNHDAHHPAPGSSYYIDVGVAPGYTFEGAGGLKIEAPTRVLLPDERFYGDFYAPSSTVGIVETGLKATIPLKFMPDGYGHWSLHAGFKYMNFVDDNLYNLNIFNAPGKPTRDTVVVFVGLTSFF